MRELGYEFLFDTDEVAFRDRVLDRLGVVCPPMTGTGKMWDFRPALGLLYEDEARGFDFWGHTDFDVVYGRVDRWVSDEFLSTVDMHSNCYEYVNGCWSLYRNTPLMRDLFMRESSWGKIMERRLPTGWAEKEFSKVIVAARDVRRKWTQWQAFGDEDLAALRLDGNRLWLHDEEIMMAHFRRTKAWPAGCVT